ncbi:MAG TPA: hypothetical protein DIC23_08005, partial [Planctomycetaceae bacterium]|nr:hypothetical protein [Planctomycetaceae bacterium]
TTHLRVLKNEETENAESGTAESEYGENQIEGLQKRSRKWGVALEFLRVTDGLLAHRWNGTREFWR